MGNQGDQQKTTCPLLPAWPQGSSEGRRELSAGQALPLGAYIKHLMA